MDESNEAIVIRLKPLTETSLIADLLTDNSGLISAVAKGARKPKSPFQGKLDLFFFLRIQLLESRRSTLHTLREAQVMETNSDLRRSLEKVRAASVAVEWVRIAVESGTPVPEIFKLTRAHLIDLNALSEANLLTHSLRFEWQLLTELGWDPQESGLFARKQVQLLASELACESAEAVGEPRRSVSLGEIRETAWLLEKFAREHLGRVPGARDKLYRDVA
jgi:DNA repair protein RecO (recombination protein O)